MHINVYKLFFDIALRHMAYSEASVGMFNVIHLFNDEVKWVVQTAVD